MTGGPVLAKTKARKEPPSILVVDDSITTRTLEKSILEAEGFRVRLAVDGLDALDSLRRERADLVISDVQMPRLDGFGLLRAIKDDPAFSTIPVIMVTSRDSEEEVRRGMELGADAYMVKQGFEQQALLDTICQFVEAP
jgi:two-component system chemotaxis sensor kinase CheA